MAIQRAVAQQAQLGFNFDCPKTQISNSVLSLANEFTDKLTNAGALHQASALDNNFVGVTIVRGRTQSVVFRHTVEDVQKTYKMSWRRAKIKLAKRAQHLGQCVNIKIVITPKTSIKSITLDFAIGAQTQDKQN